GEKERSIAGVIELERVLRSDHSLRIVPPRFQNRHRDLDIGGSARLQTQVTRECHLVVDAELKSDGRGFLIRKIGNHGFGRTVAAGFKLELGKGNVRGMQIPNGQELDFELVREGAGWEVAARGPLEATGDVNGRADVV